MSIKSMLSGIVGRQTDEGFTIPNGNYRLSLLDTYVQIKGDNGHTYSLPYSDCYMSLKHLGAWFMIQPGIGDTVIPEDNIVEVQRYIGDTYVLRCNGYRVIESRLIPDCWDVTHRVLRIYSYIIGWYTLRRTVMVLSMLSPLRDGMRNMKTLQFI